MDAPAGSIAAVASGKNNPARVMTIRVFVIIICAIQVGGLFLNFALARNYSTLEVTPYRMGLTPGEIYSNLGESPATMWEVAFWCVTIFNSVSLLSAGIGYSNVWNWAAIVMNLILVVGNLVVGIVSLAVHGFNANLPPDQGGYIFNPANDLLWCCKTEMWSNPAANCPWSVACTAHPGSLVSMDIVQLGVSGPYITRLVVIGLHAFLQVVLIALAYAATPKAPTRGELRSFFRDLSIGAVIDGLQDGMKKQKHRRRHRRRRVKTTTQW